MHERRLPDIAAMEPWPPFDPALHDAVNSLARRIHPHDNYDNSRHARLHVHYEPGYHSEHTWEDPTTSVRIAAPTLETYGWHIHPLHGDHVPGYGVDQLSLPEIPRALLRGGL